jgi:ankyrin repeat protein
LNAAIENGNEEIFDILISAGVDPKEGNLFQCIQSGRAEMARVLLQFGAEPQPLPAMENRGNVYWAVYYDQPEILKMLLDRGAKPDMVDAYGETPLSMAKKFHKAAVPILEEAIARRAAEKTQDEASKTEAK